MPVSAASTPPASNRTQQPCGFTLIELLVVLAILSVLALFAYPLYGDSVTKAKRAEAASALLRAMQQQELYYSRHNRYIAYQGNPPADAPALIWFSGGKTASSAYQISAAACERQSIAHCVILSATPGGALVDQQFRDALCGTLTLNSQGDRTANGQPLHEAPHACR